jgi:predicted DNA-binding transcriptional regulator AlpA
MCRPTALDFGKEVRVNTLPRHLKEQQKMVTLTETELATRWSMTTKTLYRWRTQNQGPKYMKLGKKILYPLAAVETYENQITVDVEAPTDSIVRDELAVKSFSLLMPRAVF